MVARDAVIGLSLLLLLSLLREADARDSLLCSRGGARMEEEQEERGKVAECMAGLLFFFLFFSSELEKARSLIIFSSSGRERKKKKKTRALSLSLSLRKEKHSEDALAATMSTSEPGTSAPAAAATTPEQLLDFVREAMKAKPLMSSSSSRVHKDECVYSFDTPFSPGGLYVNLSTWQVR